MTPDTQLPSTEKTPRGPASARITAAAAGFALSAGWYWFPRVHPLWTETTPSFSPHDAEQLALVLTLLIGVKTAALLVFGPLLGRAYAVAGVSDGAGTASPLRRRLLSSLPFFVVQVIAWVVLLPLPLPADQPETPTLLAPALFGVSDMLCSLIWLSVLIRLPGVACCFAYAAGALCGLGLHWLALPLAPSQAHLLRIVSPLLAGPLIFFAIPSGRNAGGASPGSSAASTACASAPPATVMLCVFAITACLRALIDFNENGFPFAREVPVPPEEGAWLDTLTLLAHACGGLLTAFALRRRCCLRLLVITLAFFGSCAVLLPLCGLARPTSAAVFPLHLAAGAGAAFAIFLLGRSVRLGHPLIRTTCQALVILTVVVCLSGWILWFCALRIHSEAFPPHEIYLQLLGLAVLLLIPPCYALRLPLRRLLGSRRSPCRTPMPPDDARPLSLTKREREVARLVQLGMKNIEISARLNIAETTLRVHLRSIYKKLGISGRDNLAAVDLSDIAEEASDARREKNAGEHLRRPDDNLSPNTVPASEQIGPFRIRPEKTPETD